MAALTQDKIVLTREQRAPNTSRIAIATGSKIYRGSLVDRKNTGGRAVAASAAAGQKSAGVAIGFEGPVGTGTGNAAGTEYVRVAFGSLALVNVLTAIRTNSSLGLNCFISDDQSVAGTAVGTALTRHSPGMLVEFEATDKSTGWVALQDFAATDIAV